MELRPIERRVLQLEADGVDHEEIARRFKRSAGHISRISNYARLPNRAVSRAEAGELRPIERRILAWRAKGADHDEIGQRFKRSADHIRRVEILAEYRLEHLQA